MSNWIQDSLHAEKPVITMCHLQPLPGDPYYDADGGIEKVMAAARTGLLTPQEDRVDGTMFSNEFSLPYPTRVEPVAVTATVRVIGELKPLITIPHGANCLWGLIASIDLAVAINGKFIRETISGVYASGFGLWNTNVGKTVRHKMAVGAKGLKLFPNIVPGATRYLTDRDTKDVVGPTEFDDHPDALCVSSLTASSGTGIQILGRVETSVKRTSILCNTECSVSNIARQLSVTDGAVRVIAFKYDGVFENIVDVKRAKEFTGRVREYQVIL